ncbi:MAG: hypothetical protein RI909_495 [Bacteroidota bacterium]|jgi:hypothetical protein
MSRPEALNKITSLKNRYLTLRWIELFLLAGAAVFFVWAFLYLMNASLLTKIGASVVIVIVVIAIGVVRYRLLQLSNKEFIQHLNSNYSQLEESADLLLSDDDLLTSLQKLQLQKTLKHFDSIYPEIKLPHFLPQSLGIFGLCAIAYFGLISFIAPPTETTEEASINIASVINNPAKESARISFLSISVTPPSYTQIKTFTSSTPDLKIPEGSEVRWSIKFSSPVTHPKIFLSGKDSIDLRLLNDQYTTIINLNESGFYQIQWTDRQKIIRSDYYKIEIIKDQVPKVVVDNLNQFTRLSLADQRKLVLQSTLTDDYGLTKASIIATISKGSGESVKFREERLQFERPTTISGKKVTAELKLDLNKLGMEPGDELYFYVEAVDNKTPSPNHNRTETFFIALQDTTQQVAVEDEGLGVDLMPEYFRSQRQIIIDTEKLLKERKKRTLQEFKSTSNELGYDQKVLRLRYGQFLGEEFEGQIGKVEVAEDDDDHESTIEKFSHVHDKENEHNLVADKKPITTEHSHDGEQKDPNEKENPLEAFAHNHDDGEQATFFVQSVRAKLKAALTVMWDAELYLRLFEPEKSLPYQYTALKLLKEISNDSRIYVHRTGFDPPPLKEEKRLSADLTEIYNSTATNKQEEKDLFPAIKRALQQIEFLLQQSNPTVSSDNKEQFNKAGQELAMVALEQPGQFLDGLSLLKKITDDTISQQGLPAALKSIQSIFWKVLPQQPIAPKKNELMMHQLDIQFLNSLEQLQHD